MAENQRQPRSLVSRPWNLSLCWFCRNAVPSPATGAGCSWSRKAHQPVEGWVAERRDLKLRGKNNQVLHMIESYRVLACPEFEEG